MRLLLIDANNILMRAVFASSRVSLSANGVPTAALLIFINLLSRHIREEEPTHVVLCWDGGKSVYRQRLYPAYKAHRSEHTGHDEGPFAQAKEFATLAGIHHVERSGWEADDLIAAYWQQTRKSHPEATVVILSSDKDLLQLLDDHTTQVRPVSHPPTDLWDEFRVTVAYGVDPEHLSRAMALIGDPSDNIPGVAGLGPKKAASLLVANNYDLDAAMSTRSETDQRLAALSFALIDLRTMPYSEHGLHVAPPPVFSPTPFEGVLSLSLMRYLDRYMLESIKTRLASQSLWYEASVEEK